MFTTVKITILALFAMVVGIMVSGIIAIIVAVEKM